MILTPRNFEPSQMRLRSLGVIPDDSGSQGAKYKGDIESEAYLASQVSQPDHLNCSLWVSNIHPSAAPGEIFDQIDDGAVVALHISPPDATHSMAAATLIFKAPESAARFFHRSQSWTGIWVKMEKLFVRYNSRGNERRTDDRTRVLLVDGPANIMTLDYWNKFFDFYQFRWVSMTGCFISHFPVPLLFISYTPKAFCAVPKMEACAWFALKKFLNRK
jgi:hypothetical protein